MIPLWTDGQAISLAILVPLLLVLLGVIGYYSIRRLHDKD